MYPYTLYSPIALWPYIHLYTTTIQTCTSCDKRSYKMWGWVQTHDMSMKWHHVQMVIIQFDDMT